VPAPAVTFAESALADLEAILAWYVEQDVPEVIRWQVAEILDRVQSLRNHPDLRRAVPEFDQPFLRELIHPPLSHRLPARTETHPRGADLAQRAPAAPAGRRARPILTPDFLLRLFPCLAR
jgi:plasmid stabilization system protein ParE